MIRFVLKENLHLAPETEQRAGLYIEVALRTLQHDFNAIKTEKERTDYKENFASLFEKVLEAVQAMPVDSVEKIDLVDFMFPKHKKKTFTNLFLENEPERLAAFRKDSLRCFQYKGAPFKDLPNLAQAL